MELPKTVSIAGKRIKIDVVTLSGDDPDYGMYFHDKKLIQINKGLKDKVMLETLRHEMMEASLLISGVGWLESYDQEAVVRCMEEIFFPAWETFLKRLNP